MRRVAAFVVGLLLVLTVTPTAVASPADFPQFTGEQFKTLIGVAFDELPGLRPPGDPGVITGNSSLDSRIWDLAFARGYEMRPTAVAANLVSEGGLAMQPMAAQAWRELKTAAADAGFSLWAKSAYRSVATQRSIFNRELLGTSDSSINATLAYHSVPGTSRHHTGYTLDITLPGRELWQFKGTAAYAWLTKDNYYNAKRFGFVPSYPPGVSSQGPNPEPWEFVYVGLDILAGDRVFLDVSPTHFANDAILWMHDNGYTSGCSEYFYCPSGFVTRGELAAFLHRVLGPTLGPATASDFTDTAGHLFVSDVRWLAGHGITRGCDPPANTRFCPDSTVSRGELAAMIHRGLADLVVVDQSEIDLDRFVDANDSIFRADIAWLGAAGVTKGCNPPSNDHYCPALKLTRADVAVFLQRIVGRLGNT
jgi:hypothetical protein